MERTHAKYPKRFIDDDSALRGLSKGQHHSMARNKNILTVAYPNDRKMLPRLY
jgi:hypothetical protein